jgi:hypothetical protein
MTATPQVRATHEKHIAAYRAGAERARSDVASGIELSAHAIEEASLEANPVHELAVTWRDGYRVARNEAKSPPPTPRLGKGR